MRKVFCLIAVLGVFAWTACDETPSTRNDAGDDGTLDNSDNSNNSNNPSCGNGVAERGEECDQTDLSGGTCETAGAFSGGALACTAGCTFDTTGCIPACAHPNWEACDPLGADACCPRNGLPSECFFINADAGSICLQTCSDGADCGYSLNCYSASGGLCFPKYCGGGTGGSPLSQPCALDGDREGTCLGTGSAMDDTGICLEDGLAAHGQPCTSDPENSPMGRLLTEAEMTRLCDGGVCLAMDAQGNPTTDGTCLQACDPVAVHDGVALNTDPDQPWVSTDACPENSNCVNFSSIDQAPTDDQGNPNAGHLFRKADLGLCYPTGSGVVSGAGLTSCDLLTGRSIRTGEACAMMPVELLGFPVTELETTCQVIADGSLIGACQPAEAEADRLSLGAACDPAHERILYYVVPVTAAECAAGTLCLAGDPLHAADVTTAPTRCVKPCDARLGEVLNPDCSGLLDDGGNPTVCLTMSRYFTTDHLLPTRTNAQTGDPETETAPSPLGLCVPAL